MVNTTKKAISEALLSLLAKKPLNKITINDIADGCGISRMTFYYHFRDIYDLLEWICMEETSQVLKSHMGGIGWEAAILQVLQRMERNKRLILNVYRGADRALLAQRLSQVAESLLDALTAEMAVGIPLSESGRKHIISMYSSAVLGNLWQWLHRGMTEPPEVVLMSVEAVLQGGLRASLVRMSQLENAGHAAVSASAPQHAALPSAS